MPDARAPLLTDDDVFTPAAESALKEIFSRFDVDKDGNLSRAEIDAFAIAANGEKFDEATIEELSDSFDTTADGKLTLEGFLDMYHLQTLSDEDETWKDLKTFGYDDKLVKSDTQT
ncbi:uncharacterized protein SPPG_04354 [Spizellomyces punctatus DAOM BR117]|uniref:EF-hand domain-containing protein n=1 Tax=Spizellomyces punctatus (strain DAOM BR117) TaxID=645134 RepID=A0A0L0HG50_SPIPD|nr:uncharacterized protein SPPG_04354 [Spizellomyces punctatus DAOM BR117]KND00007.1 hypothetical protein SPPG_04354 [Spizellomyces punctatus DAOM BR117]|eukprot:XP_016608046.1 hypothetical protein SPPG_04354 [Spizellomyces punctatus DAOM BR117]